MDFFQAQDQARKRTRWLLVLFALAVISIIAVVYIIAGFFLLSPETGFWDRDLLLLVAIFVGGLIGLGSWYKIVELKAGGSAVAEMLGGRRVDPASRDLQERKLLNVVEEMSIASGLTPPPVYVLDEESSINAFAAGFGSRDAAVGITRGAMEKLSRDELQAVIAHEFSHILNGDMRLNLRLMGVLHGILLLTILGSMLFRAGCYAGSGKDRDARIGLVFILIGLVLIVVGYVGLFFAKLIKACVSRQREYLADAAAVQFTRNPAGMVGVLKKIGGLTLGSRLFNSRAEEASHLFFSNAVGGALSRLLATHPPLEARIRVIDPNWDGRFEPILASYVAEPVPPKDCAAAGSGLSPGSLVAPLQKLTPVMIMAGIGQLRPRQIGYAQQLLRSLPEALKEAVHETFSARAMVLALVLSEETNIREVQLAHLRANRDPVFVDEVLKLWEFTRTLPSKLRLPCAELALPALRLMSPPQLEVFRSMCRDLIEADQAIDLFEFVLLKLLERHLPDPRNPAADLPPIYRRFDEVREPVHLLLSALAHRNENPSAAFLAGTKAIGMNFSEGLKDFTQADLGAVDEALQILGRSSPQIRRKVVFACANVVLADHQVNDLETDLLRAIADALGCPMPPLQTLLQTEPAS